MNPPTILSYWSSKSMELVTQRLETGHEYATLPLMHTRCLPNVIPQPAERIGEARRPERNHSRSARSSQNTKVSNKTFENHGLDGGIEFLKDFGVYRIKI